jgi:L-lactate dehydrogenase
MPERRGKGKVAVVGTGAVGSTTAFALMMDGIASEIVLVDIDKEKAEGEAMDLNHGAYFTPPANITTGDYEDCWDADVVIVTAGANQGPDETRLDLIEKNTAIFEEMIPQITEGLNDDAILLVVTNPVDILSYVSWDVSDLPHNRVLGSGTVLDTSRFRHVLSQRMNVDPKNVHAYVVGEHGDTEAMVWSSTNVAGVPFDKYADARGFDHSPEMKETVADTVQQAAYEIIDRKGATYYAIALATVEIVETIIRDEKSILTISTLAQGEYGLDDVYLSVPAVLDRNGVREIVEFDLDQGEQHRLERSANVLAENLEKVGYQ